MSLFSLILIGVGLSMDAFSLALCYGILNLSKKIKKILSLTVGLFHFFMPLLGMLFGHALEHYVVLDMRYIVFAIFMILGIEMLYSINEKSKSFLLLNNIGILIFAFTVSIDSFSAGIGIKLISNNYLLCSAIFSLISFISTYVGLKIGGIIGEKYGDLSKAVGGLILAVFALRYLFI
ncbi:MAG: manganese efflux pump [Bacilli bacterium]|jgi:putative Mn2+ efflux pump MntP